MKSIPPALLAHYASGATTLARLWYIEWADGETVFTFTDHDRELKFARAGEAEERVYKPTSSFDPSAVATRADLNVDNAENTGLLDDEGINDTDLEAGRWDGAWFELYEVNWADLSMGANPLRVGRLGQAKRRTGKFTTELRGLMQAYANNIGRVVTPTCDAILGDDRCRADLSAFEVDGTVDTVTNRRAFTALGITDPAGFYSGGSVAFTSGLNTGVSMEIKTHASATGGASILLQLPMPFDITAGDAFTMTPGCDHIHQVLDDGTVEGDCLNKYDNVLNFRGFDDVPGQDQMLLVGGQ